MLLDTWLMSCRVLGRHVEAATLNVLAARARQMGASALVGVFRPSAKNGMVKDHYLKLGFEPADAVDGETTWRLSLTTYDFIETPITLVEGAE